MEHLVKTLTTPDELIAEIEAGFPEEQQVLEGTPERKSHVLNSLHAEKLERGVLIPNLHRTRESVHQES